MSKLQSLLPTLLICQTFFNIRRAPEHMPGHGLRCEVSTEAAFYFSMGGWKSEGPTTRSLSLRPFPRSSRCFSRTAFLKAWSRPRNLSDMQILRPTSRPSQSEVLGVGPRNWCFNKTFWTILMHPRVWEMLFLRRLVEIERKWLFRKQIIVHWIL